MGVPPRRIMIPLISGRNLSSDGTLERSTLPVAGLGKRAAGKTPPDLALVMNAWSSLPEALRAGIVAMVEAASLPVRRPSGAGEKV